MNNCKTFLHIVFLLNLTIPFLGWAEQIRPNSGKGLCNNTAGDETSMVYVKPKMVSGLKKFDLTLVLLKKKPKLQTDRKFYHGFDCFSGNAGARKAYFCKGEVEGGAQILLSVSQADEGFQVVWKTRESDSEDFSSLDWGSGFQCNLDGIIKDSVVAPQSKVETINRAVVSPIPPKLAGKEDPPKETEVKVTKNKKEKTPPEVVYWDPEEDAKKTIVSRQLSSPKSSYSSDSLSESESSYGAQ
ncbi:MAG: hypothetical protein RJB66_2598 [Pseudomonadota bacterium]